ncbi:MAG: MarR family transcriptional regulator [Gammaproteobacteria bacterium]|nr:MarR family transcriptional regulator [Gammaproteobacteria bacterium]
MQDKNLFEIIVETLPQDEYRMRAWLALLGCFTSVERTLRKRFASDFQSSLPRYDVLTTLAQFRDGLTMGQLAAKLMVTKGNITGVVSRLESRAYIKRSVSDEDRRVQLVTLTGAGRELWEEMHAVYREVIEDALRGLTDSDAETLAQRLTDTQVEIDRVLLD